MTEGRSTGIPKILKEMAATGSPAPLFETDDDRLSFVIRLPCHPLSLVPTTEVTTEVERVLRALIGEMSCQELQAGLSLKNDEHFRKAYLLPALRSGLVEMPLPDTPRSSKQRYRLTTVGRRWLEAHPDGSPA